MLGIMNSLVDDIAKKLRKKNLTLGTVESATGGLIANLITNLSGSSDFFKGSIVSYSNEIKSGVVGVKKESLEKYGAVSSIVAEEMASGGRRVLNVDICLSDTGIAGPTGQTQDKPVGLFYLGFACKEGTYSRKFSFAGSRMENKQSAAQTALHWLNDYLSGTWQSELL
jgi:nicotinamide-nucleotide amidase